MTLLSFTVRNHASLRDEVTLDFTRPGFSRLTPPDADWAAVTYPMAGIFGANATGKSSLLDAMRYFFGAIHSSATAWQASKSMVRNPFLLDESSRNDCSSYELDFVFQGVRHRYGFEVDADGIVAEWLLNIPYGRWRTLVRRERTSEQLKMHPEVKVQVVLTDRELLLSRCLLMPQSKLHSLARFLVTHFDCVLVDDSHRRMRLSQIADSLAEKSISFADLEALLYIADTGITAVTLEEMDESAMPHNVRSALRLLMNPDEDNSDDVPEPDMDDEARNLVLRSLKFTHRGAGSNLPEFPMSAESNGTVAWLAVAVPAVSALRNGGLLAIDEIDASLHPFLLDLLLAAFSDPSINEKHAQLLFTSHDTHILSPANEATMEPDQIWLTEKSMDGATELTCLSQFPKRSDANLEKRYLAGRYGGVPRLSPSLFAALVSDED